MILPSLVLGLLLSYGLAMLPPLLAAAPPGSLQIDVTGEQYFWRVRYPRANADPVELANELRLPVGQHAQLQLDRMLAAQGEAPVEIVAPAGNPFTAGHARASTAFKVGDRYAYRVIDRMTGAEVAERELVLVVTAISETEVIMNRGRIILDLLGNMVQNGKGQRFTPRQEQPLEYVVGKKWTTRFGVSKGEDDQGITELQFRIAGRERISVPAGTFDCYRIEGTGVIWRGGRESTDVSWTVWRAPDQVRTFVARGEEKRRSMRGHVTTVSSERRELVSFKQH